jgi:protein-L-isoaspartate O-methyltransferase
LWYADRVRCVVAVEDSEKWAEIVTQRLPSNGKVVYQASKNDYVSEVLNHDEFDVIVIDGSYRTDCAKTALEALSDDGVIIWDDFDWLEEDKYEAILSEGFSILPFRGLKALGANYNCTTIFYRENNCLNI